MDVLPSRGEAGGGLSGGLRVVALAASAGGLQAISGLLHALPADFPAAIVVVQHLSPSYKSLMHDILGRRCLLPVSQVRAGDRLRAGCVCIAPPDRHVEVNPDGTLSLTDDARVHYVRPSADVLFESLARSFGDRAIAVVLTGRGSDGTPGVSAIKRGGGTVIAQDRGTSEHFGMPAAAIATHDVDLVLPLELIAPALVRLVGNGHV
jgi:two-component system chemotaxis response regulator CheB